MTFIRSRAEEYELSDDEALELLIWQETAVQAVQELAELTLIHDALQDAYNKQEQEIRQLDILLKHFLDERVQ